MIKKFLGVFFFYFAISSCNLDINDKPNIIVFIADDVSWDDIGVYGNDQVVTPNIDNLAKNGLIFNKFQAKIHITKIDLPKHIFGLAGG